MSFESSDKSIRSWLYFIVITISLGFVSYTLYDLKQDIKKTTAQVRESNEMIKEKLPPILDNSKRASDALVRLTNDVTILRNLISPSNEGQETPVTLASFASKVCDIIEKSDLMISSRLEGKTAKQWVADERQECLLLAFRVNSKREMLEKMCSTMFGNSWMVTPKGGEKMPMLDWLRKNNTEIDQLFVQKQS